MKVNYYFRNPRVGYSIHTVFNTVIGGVAQCADVCTTCMPSPRAGLPSIICNCLCAFRHQRKGWVNHVTGDVYYLLSALRGSRTVVTVHDIMYYHCLRGVKKRLWKWLYIRPLRRAACVTFISDFARRQVEEVMPLPADRVVVIPNPVSPRYRFEPKEFNAERPQILHIGTMERKNLRRIILALCGLSCHLRIIGRPDDETLRLLGDCGTDYSVACDLTDEQMADEYRRADMVSFASLAEGFGMPIIEGQATGRVVVTSALPPMNEVAGGGAVLVDPLSVESIRHGFLAAMRDAELRRRLIAIGRANVERFSAETIAAQYVALYRRVFSDAR